MVVGAATSVLLVVLLALATTTSYAFAWYFRQKSTHPASDRFAKLMIADGSWALFVLCQMLSPTDDFALALENVVQLASALAAVYWFLFVVDYTGDRWLVPDWLRRLLVAEAVLFGVAFTVNPRELVYSNAGVESFGALRLTFETFGLGVIVQLLVAYTLLGSSFVLLGRFFLQTRNLYRKQAGVIFVVTFLIVCANAVFITRLSPVPNLDLTPAFFALQAAGVGVSLYRYDFLNVVPLAADTVLEELTDPVLIVDQHGRIVDWNGAATPYLPPESTPTLEDIHIDGLPLVEDGGETETVVSSAAHADDLGRVFFDVRTTAITDRYDIVRGYAVVLRDVTERRHRERALETQNERLEEFTGIVSHDLRNPLQVIDGHLELASETGDLDHVEAAKDGVDRIERLLDDLLRLAQQGRTIEETTATSLAAAVREAWSVVGSADASLSVETDRTVAADAERLQQALENLFRNAVEHGGNTVTVGDTDDGFYVEDDGPGIPAGERGTVFEFGVTTSEDSTGFGLAIVERIVEAHGWSISVTESNAGGACFEVSFDDGGPPALEK